MRSSRRARVSSVFLLIHSSKGSRSYNLSVLLKSGAKERLLTGLSDARSALFFEQQLEQWFGIGDRPVEGELQR